MCVGENQEGLQLDLSGNNNEHLKKAQSSFPHNFFKKRLISKEKIKRLLLILGFHSALTKEGIVTFVKVYVGQIKCEADYRIKKLKESYKTVMNQFSKAEYLPQYHGCV